MAKTPWPLGAGGGPPALCSRHMPCRSICVGNGPENDAGERRFSPQQPQRTVTWPCQWTGGLSSTPCPPGPSREKGSSILGYRHLGRVSRCCGGSSCVSQGAEQHPFLPTCCDNHQVSRHCYMSPGDKNAPPPTENHCYPHAFRCCASVSAFHPPPCSHLAAPPFQPPPPRDHHSQFTEAGQHVSGEQPRVTLTHITFLPAT